MINHWMFRCRDISEKISKSMDTALPVRYRIAVWLHLRMCRYCTRFRQQLILLRAAGRSMRNGYSEEDAAETLSEEAKARIREKLRTLA